MLTPSFGQTIGAMNLNVADERRDRATMGALAMSVGGDSASGVVSFPWWRSGYTLGR